MLRRVALEQTDVSEEYIFSIFMVPTRTTRRHIPENILHSQSPEDLNSYCC
jgi:hypothetical protein